MTADLRERILKANIEVHQFEAQNYESLHPEVYGSEEQHRICFTLNQVDQLVKGNRRKVLDFGAGTGNLTGKLLSMGYTVTAVDISAEMCAVLERKYQAYVAAEKLLIIHSSIEGVDFGKEEFDVIACYSVLHHLPDYVAAVRGLSHFLRKGGVLYIDHEASPSYWSRELSSLASLLKSLYLHSNPVLNALYFSLMGVEVPKVEYTLSDYWHKKEHSLDHDRLRGVFEEENFEFSERTDYHLKGTWIPNPVFYAYRYFCKPEMSYWIARK